MLFDSICNSQWFVKTSTILFLNKVRARSLAPCRSQLRSKVAHTLDALAARRLPGASRAFADPGAFSRLRRCALSPLLARPTLHRPDLPFPPSLLFAGKSGSVADGQEYFKRRFVSLNRSSRKEICASLRFRSLLPSSSALMRHRPARRHSLHDGDRHVARQGRDDERVRHHPEPVRRPLASWSLFHVSALTQAPWLVDARVATCRTSSCDAPLTVPPRRAFSPRPSPPQLFLVVRRSCPCCTR